MSRSSLYLIGTIIIALYLNSELLIEVVEVKVKVNPLHAILQS